MEFPRFGEVRNTTDVLNFVEQCENVLSVRLVSDIELMATFSSVLTGLMGEAKELVGG